VNDDGILRDLLREYQSPTQTSTCHARRQIAMQPHGEPELVADLPQNLKKVSATWT